MPIALLLPLCSLSVSSSFFSFFLLLILRFLRWSFSHLSSLFSASFILICSFCYFLYITYAFFCFYVYHPSLFMFHMFRFCFHVSCGLSISSAYALFCLYSICSRFTMCLILPCSDFPVFGV
jgi:hypothetical protein